VVTVCPQCRSAVSRKGVRLESLGTVAELVPTSSPFRIGTTGKPKGQGLKPFRIVGRLQLSTGEGTWDEWHVSFEDGRYAWLAEAQGGFWVMRPLPAPTNPPAPEFPQIAPGQRLSFGPYGSFTVTDRRQALYASAEGDLPFAAVPGSVFMYADLSGADGSLATLDYGDDPGVDAFFVGRKVELHELGVEGLEEWSQRKVAARASSLNCPACGAGLQLKDPAHTVRVACTYCGSVLATPKDGASAEKFEVLARLQKVPFQPLLPLGGEGTLRGRPYAILGAVLKACTVDGTNYYWREYLLKEKKTEAFHWLVESNGHWTLVEAVAAGEVSKAPRLAAFRGTRYRHFQSTTARVEAVLGEFYWEVKKGEKTDVSDYVAPPRILSEERYENEVTWSEGCYVPKEEVEAAFAPKAPLPLPEGVGSNQPWPHAATAPGLIRTLGLFAGIALFLFVFFNIRAERKVLYEARQDLAAASDQALSPDAASELYTVVSEPFEITRSGNVEARISAPTDNSWVFVNAVLLEQETGQAYGFGLQSDYYHGVDGGERWSEGSRSRTVYVGRVPAGRYVLRLEPELERGRAPSHYDIRLRSGVPRLAHLVLVLVFLLFGPIALAISKARFEGRRWAESDYAGGDDE
jgi:ribosomal protein S27E